MPHCLHYTNRSQLSQKPCGFLVLTMVGAFRTVGVTLMDPLSFASTAVRIQILGGAVIKAQGVVLFVQSPHCCLAFCGGFYSRPLASMTLSFVKLLPLRFLVSSRAQWVQQISTRSAVVLLSVFNNNVNVFLVRYCCDHLILSCFFDWVVVWSFYIIMLFHTT